MHKLYNLPNLSMLILLIPLIFLPSQRLGIKNPWSLSLFLLPFIYLLYPKNFLEILLQAFAEELFFRAYLMQSFSNLKVSLLFTIPHVILYTSLWSFLTFLPSLFFGFVYQKTGSLALVSLLHMLSNLFWWHII
ncbi:MAG: type II CAAX prenyl endopeptidase Rce1 family protein [Aquificaceae bacterium]